MKTVDEEAKMLMNDFGALAKDVVKRIIPECYDGSLPFWKNVYYKINELQANDAEKSDSNCNIPLISKSCPCCDGTGYCEGEHYDDLQACITCGGSGHVC